MIDSCYWIWYQTIFGIGTRRAELFLNFFENPLKIYQGIEEKNPDILRMLEEKELAASGYAMETAKNIYAKVIRNGCSVITPDHPDYPVLLKEIYSKPTALYVKGDLSCLKENLSIAMVGTRYYSEYGAKAAEAIAQQLALKGVVVVSGLAKGIDTFCHTAALFAGGKSIGILGCGLDIDYPKGSAKLKRQLCENGAVISEYPFGVVPHQGNFPMRNRLISGMTHGTVVVEADEKSGSIITARHAESQGRDVFAVPGSIFSAKTSGTHKLIKDGAKLTQTASDIIEEFTNILEFNEKNNQDISCQDTAEGYQYQNLQLEKFQAPIKTEAKAKPPKAANLDISDHGKEIILQLEDGIKTVEEIAQNVEMSMPALYTALTELEFYGLISGYPGRRFGLS